MESIKAELEYWDATPNDRGNSKLLRKEIIAGNNDIEIFEKFYKLNNSLKYCNGSYYVFHSTEWNDKYWKWIKSDDYKNKSFNLYYGNGVVD